MTKRERCALFAVLLTALAGSCGGPGTPPSRKPPETPAVTQEAREGPLRLRLVLDRDRITMADTLQLVLEARAPEAWEATLPSYGERMGRFGVLDYREEPPRLAEDDRILVRRTYTLEPLLPGEHVLGPAEVAFVSRQDPREGEAVEKRLKTEPVPVHVESLLEDHEGETALRPLLDPLPPPPTLPWIWLWSCLASIALISTIVFLRIHRSRRLKKSLPPPAPPHELALRRIGELEERGFLQRGDFKPYFGGLSDILRDYIQDRFHLRAPARTTEEFLEEIRFRPGFPPEHRRLLNDFLNRCDLVKFAEHLPTEGEIRKALEACRAFIEATQTVEESGPAGRSPRPSETGSP